MNQKKLQEKIQSLEPWFHNIHLPDGTQTAPEHFLGDFPAFKWEKIAPHLSDDLSGKTVLDIGCNAGFYSVKLAQRGARVTAIDLDPHYLEQAKWICNQFKLEEKITLKQQQVYDLARDNKQYDIIWFMGVFYHLRYPLLALDIVSRKVNEMLVFQTLSLPEKTSYQTPGDCSIHNRKQMLDKGWPKMAFIEKSLNGDPTNWWVANKTGVEAMLRTCGFMIRIQPGDDIFLCEPDTQNPGVSKTWNESEYLSAIGENWYSTYSKKVQ